MADLVILQSLRRGVRRVRAHLRFRREFGDFARLSAVSGRDMQLAWRDRYPCLDDHTAATTFDRHYVYHTAWAARILAETRPETHTDIASTLYFAGIVSAFLPVRFYDYRPADLRLSRLTSDHADLTNLHFGDGSLVSLSCMHVIEHIGLGRYGDPLDPNGDLKAMAELKRVLAPGGTLLLVVPVGRPKIAFNAHRIYSYDQVRTGFDGLELRQFSLIPDMGAMVANAAPDLVSAQEYGCGCFWFQRSSTGAQRS